MARTESEIKRLLEGKLYPGKAVTIEHWAKQSDGVWNFKGSVKGVVTALYPHIFMVEVGGYPESYRYSQCFEQNHERVKV